MKCLKLFPVLFVLLLTFLLFSCQSNLQKAGHSHALTFKKWQALSKYTRASYLSNYPSLYIVGELSIDSTDQGKKFILKNIQLSDTETAFQINVLHPQFESKYICTPQCLQLTEYLQQDNDSNTMLTRYFDQHEFELFKLYGEIFSLDEKIQENPAIETEYFTHYINWVIKQQESSADIKSFIVYLKRVFTEEAYVSFIAQPQQLYSHLIQPSDDKGLVSAASETALWSDTSASETALWSDASATETELWSDTATENIDSMLGNSFENIAEQQLQNFSELNIELGDLVCTSTSNEFGTVREIRGKNIIVDLIGQILSYSDGVSVATKPSDIYNNNIVKHYTPVDKIEKTYERAQLSKCHLG